MSNIIFLMIYLDTIYFDNNIVFFLCLTEGLKWSFRISLTLHYSTVADVFQSLPRFFSKKDSFFSGFFKTKYVIIFIF